MPSRKLILLALVLAPLLRAQTATINGGTALQAIDGFGGESGGPMPWTSSPYNWNAIDSTTASAMFSPTAGIGISIYRTGNVDGTSSTLPPDMTSLTEAYGLGAKIELDLSSPPASMKYSGTFYDGTPGGSGSCLSASNSTYATYVTQLIQNIQSSGSVVVSWVGVQNEPNSYGTTPNNGQGSCGWDAAALDSFTTVLGPALSAAGLSTKIILGEAFDYANSPNYFGTCIADSSCKGYVSVVSGHGYGYPDTPVAPGSGGYPALSAGYHLWQGETSDNGASSFNSGMTDSGGSTGGLTMAENIDSFLYTGQVSSYNWWELGYISNGGTCQNCNLIGNTGDVSTLVFSKRFYAFGNWSKFVRPGQVEISATHNPQSGVTVTAFKNSGTGAFEIVAVNSNSGSVSQPFSLSSLTAASVTPYITDASNNLAAQSNISISASTFTATLTGSSVTTFVSNSGGGGSNCPASTPLAGTGQCYFAAASGSDSNNGTNEATPFLHAPGMPNCTSLCAAVSAGSGGIGIILRGGDTWHTGNSGAAPYTGGTWGLYDWFSNAYGENNTTCAFEGTQTGCIYVGVDPTWFSGATWQRPIITGDNPTVVGAGNFASSCAYQSANTGQSWGPNSLVTMPGWTIFDSIELTGLCSSASSTSNGQSYFDGFASSGTYPTTSILHNVYAHGWSATSTAGSGSASHPLTIISGGGGVRQALDQIVIDGSDSNPEVSAWGAFPFFTHIRYSMFRYTGQGVGQDCHDIHDNIWEYMFYTNRDGHINILECNADHSGSTANVFYNNTFRHFDPSVDNAEIVWFCPNTTPEYWFNNLMYDTNPPAMGQSWNVVGPPTYAGCTNTGGQYMFNNTMVDQSDITCYLPSNNNTLGQYLHVYNNHLINTPWDGSGSQTGHCSGGPGSTTNVPQTDAAATAQGYTTGSSGTVGNGNTCANDSTKPCTPTSAGNATVHAGSTLSSYCSALAAFSSEPAIGTDAANACALSTTNGCSYNATTHSMICPAQTAVAR